MAETLSATQAARHFAEYLNRVAYRRESFIVVRGNKPVAELRPLPTGKRLSELPSLLASLPHLAAEEVDAFARDLDAGRREANEREDRDPWRS